MNKQTNTQTQAAQTCHLTARTHNVVHKLCLHVSHCRERGQTTEALQDKQFHANNKKM